MCCNILQLGALNVYWLASGLLLALSNVLPFSTDCTQAMPSWLGVEHECNSLEYFLNLVWCVTVAGWGLTVASVAALPKMVANYPAAANKAAMLAISAVAVPFWLSYLAIALNLKVEAEGQKANLMGTAGMLSIIEFILLAVAVVVHREPTTGEKAMF